MKIRAEFLPLEPPLLSSRYKQLHKHISDVYQWYFSRTVLLSVREQVDGHKYMWASQYVRSRTGRLLLERLAWEDNDEQEIQKVTESELFTCYS